MPVDPFEGDLLAAPLPAAGQDFDARRIVCSTSYLFWQDTFWGEAEAQRDSEEIRPEADESEARINFAGYATFSTRDVDRDRALQKSHDGQSPWGHDVAGPDLAYETGPGDPAFGVSMDHSARFIERHSSEIHGMGWAIRGHQGDLPAVQEVSGTTGTGRAETSLSISSWAGERNPYAQRHEVQTSIHLDPGHSVALQGESETCEDLHSSHNDQRYGASTQRIETWTSGQGDLQPASAGVAALPALQFQASIVLSSASGRSGSASWADFDNDGLMDLFLSNHGSDNVLLRNEGSGSFSDVTSDSLVRPDYLPFNYWGDTHGSVWADLDNDGDQDLFVSVGADVGLGEGPNQVYLNEDGVLRDAAAQLGLSASLGRGRQPTVLDANNDGLPDVFMGNFNRPDGLAPPELFLQDVDGRFQAFDGGSAMDWLAASQAITADLTGDGLPELITFALREDRPPNVFYQLQVVDFSTGTPTLILENLLNEVRWRGFLPQESMIVEDFNNDSRPDLYFSPSQLRSQEVERVLYLNDGDSFINASVASGIEDADGLARSVVAGDFDNDGDIDIFEFHQVPGSFEEDEQDLTANNIFLWNDGNANFTVDAESAPSVAGGAPKSVTSVDADNDGFLDLFLVGSYTNDLLYLNQGNQNHSISIDLVGTASNRDGIGAKVYVTAAGNTQVREVSNGSHSEWAQNDQRLHFGLGDQGTVDEITVVWPSGVRQSLQNVDVDQVVRVEEPGSSLVVEYGQFSVSSRMTEIGLRNEFVDPVVVVLSLGSNGPDVATVQVLGVDSDSFSARIREPQNSPDGGFHNFETATYLAAERGTWLLEDGRLLTADTLDTDTTLARGRLVWDSVQFERSFDDGRPVVFSQLQTANGSQLAVTRQTNSTDQGFQVAMQEEEGLDGFHVEETIGYIAMEQGQTDFRDVVFNVESLEPGFGGSGARLLYGIQEPVVVSGAGISSIRGADPVYLRTSQADTEGVNITLTEETTADPETFHTDERIDIFMATAEADIFGMPFV
jgi:hypothetical protein